MSLLVRHSSGPKNLAPRWLQGLSEISIFSFFLFSLILSSIFRHPIREHVHLIAATIVASQLFTLGWLGREKGALRSWLWGALFTFGAITIGTSVFQTDEIFATRGWAIFFAPYTLFLFLCLVPRALGRESYERLLRALVITLSCISLVCLCLYATGVNHLGPLRLAFIGFTEENFYRYCLFINRNYSAQFVLWVPAAAIYLITSGGRKSKLAYSLAALITTSHVVVSLSRGAQLMLAISLIPFLLNTFSKNRKWFWGIVLLLGLIVGGVIATQPFAQTKYLTEMGLNANRWKYWIAGLNYMQRSGKWLFGAGLFNYWPLGDNPHASYLSLLLYYGVTGLGALLWALGIVAKKVFAGWSTIQKEIGLKSLLALVVAVLFGAFFEDYISYPVQFTQLYLWFLMGFVLTRVSKSKSDTDGPT